MIFEDEAPSAPPNAKRPPAPGAARIALKVVPGSRQEAIVGRLGDRLKVKVSAPPEGGRANDAVCRLLATALNVKPANVQVVSGHSNPEKVVRVIGVTRAILEATWPA